MITFTKVNLPNGWLSNMSPHKVMFGSVEWKTSEALFQSLRFSDEAIKELIRNEKSPMDAKAIMNENDDRIILEKHGKKDIQNMEMCLRLKLKTNPSLVEMLLETGDKVIIEDVTKRGDVGGNLFWGAMMVENEDGLHWVGENKLGKLWMKIRDNYILTKTKE